MGTEILNRLRPLRGWLFAYGIILLAVFLLRVVPVQGWLQEHAGGPRLFGVDSYYHLRHVQQVATDFPRLDRHETVTAYPLRERSDAVGLFQIALGAGVRARYGADPTLDETLRFCAWAGPVLGLLAYAFFAMVLTHAFGPFPALLTTLVLVLYPGTLLDRSLYGFCDHHIVEVIFFFWIYLGWKQATRQRRPRLLRDWLLWKPVLPVVLFLYTWNGAPILALLLILVAGLYGTLRVLRKRAVRLYFLNQARYFLSTALLTAAIAMIFPDLRITPEFYRYVIIAFVLSGVAAGLASWALARWKSKGGIWLLGIGVAVGIAVVPMVGTGRIRLFLHLLLREKGGGVMEHLPWSPELWWARLGPWLAIIVIGIALAVFEMIRRAPFRGTLSLYAAGMVGLAMQTGDYDYYVVPCMLVFAAYAFLALETWLARVALIKAEFRRAGLVLACLASGLFIYPVGPLAGTFRPDQYYDNFLIHEPAWDSALAFLRGKRQADAAPVGVWSIWYQGNLIAALGGQAALASRYPRAETWAPLLETREEAALAATINGAPFSSSARYLVLDASSTVKAFLTETQQLGINLGRFLETVSTETPAGRPIQVMRFNQTYADTLLFSLYGRDAANLRHFRLVHESDAQSFLRYSFDPVAGRLSVLADPLDTPQALAEAREKATRLERPWIEDGTLVYGPEILSTVKVFEQVPGLRLLIAYPGADRMVASLPVRNHASGREWFVHQEGQPTPDGRFYFVLPYSHDSSGNLDIRPRAPYLLTIFQGETILATNRFEAAEADVRAGVQYELNPR